MGLLCFIQNTKSKERNTMGMLCINFFCICIIDNIQGEKGMEIKKHVSTNKLREKKKREETYILEES